MSTNFREWVKMAYFACINFRDLPKTQNFQTNISLKAAFLSRLEVTVKISLNDALYVIYKVTVAILRFEYILYSFTRDLFFYYMQSNFYVISQKICSFNYHKSITK